ncbi:Lacal_2735 family protein [Algoriphagus boritolerans]
MLSEAHKLSHSNRTAADKLMAEAEEIAKKNRKTLIHPEKKHRQ